MADKIFAFQEALGGNDPGRILSLQNDILADVGIAERELEGSSSKVGEQIRGAIGDLRNGIGGDFGKLNSAYQRLQEAAGRSAGASTPTPIVVITPTAAADRADVDLQPYGNELRGKLSRLQERADDGDQEELATLREELRAEVARASEALGDDESEQAARFRSALGAADGVELPLELVGDVERPGTTLSSPTRCDCSRRQCDRSMPDHQREDRGASASTAPTARRMAASNVGEG